MNAGVLIVGGAVAAVNAVEQLRELGHDQPIVMICPHPGPPLSPPLMTHRLAGECTRGWYRDDGWHDRFGVQAVTDRAVAVDPLAHLVTTAAGQRIEYQKLLLATGSVPAIPSIPGLDNCPHHSFTDQADLETLTRGARNGQRATVLGAGPIGLKTAESLARRGLHVTVVERQQWILPSLLEHTGAAFVSRHARAHGLCIITGRTVCDVTVEQGEKRLRLDDGMLVRGDLLVVATGVRPNTDWLNRSGLELGRGVLVGPDMAASVADIWAAGDIAELRGCGPRALLPDAAAQGRTAGRSMAGLGARYAAEPPFNALSLFGLPLVAMGASPAPGTELVVDTSAGHRCIVVRDGILVGCVMIGNIDRAGLVRALIAGRIPASELPPDFAASPRFLALRHRWWGETIQQRESLRREPSPVEQKRRDGTVEIDAASGTRTDLNRRLRQTVEDGAASVRITRALGHRYIAAGLTSPVRIEVRGTAGNDAGALMSGPRLEIFGNAQDGLGNTMDDGLIIVHGSAGDIPGYAMRGGAIFIRDSAGFRAGIHLKGFGDRQPALVIGRCAGAFLGEYMAGGVIVVMGLDGCDRPLIGQHTGTGMHGGRIYVRGDIPTGHTSSSCLAAPVGEEDTELLENILCSYRAYFGQPIPSWREFVRLSPVGSRPYGGLYAH